jgi:hypothetical protein
MFKKAVRAVTMTQYTRRFITVLQEFTRLPLQITEEIMLNKADTKCDLMLFQRPSRQGILRRVKM